MPDLDLCVLRDCVGTRYRTMALYKRQAVLFLACLSTIALEYTTGSPDDCYQYRRKGKVTIDVDHCLWKNYTEPRTKRFCLDACFENEMVRN